MKVGMLTIKHLFFGFIKFTNLSADNQLVNIKTIPDSTGRQRVRPFIGVTGEKLEILNVHCGASTYSGRPA
jgi:hypothetical protein